MTREELKEAIIKDLNSEDYTFIVEVRRNTIIGRWKTQQLPKNIDKKKIQAFSVKYKLNKDGTFSGGEMFAHSKDYSKPMSTENITVFSISASKNLPWRKKVDSKERAYIGYDTQKLFSIIEHYLMEHGFFYRPGIWNHARLSWEAGSKLRLAGGLFLIVGLFLFIGFMSGSTYTDLFCGLLMRGEVFVASIILLSSAILLPLILIILGILLLLIGFCKMDFYDLRPDVGVKLTIGIILISWLLVFALMIIVKMNR